ncbi:MAG: acetylxylan esterase [Chloroflexota bacterium]|nr:acetylxylan esterase [Chloroflexota bacterium]
MALFDMPLEELQRYKPQREEPSDFDAFWRDTLAETREHALEARFDPVDFGLSTVETYDVTFNGFGGHPIKGWFLMPRHRTASLPCVVEFIGYGGGRGHPTDWLLWSSVGYAHLIMDTRGQGSSWSPGDTPDPGSGANAHFPGFMTEGILGPRDYYYRRVFTDGVRAVEAALGHAEVDNTRIAVSGGSQGGGVSLAVAALHPEVSVVMPDVPFLCMYRRATEITDSSPYSEISRYCQIHRNRVGTVFTTLSYFDGVNFAARSRGRALFSVGLMDEVCPPSTVYAAFNHYAGDKDIRVWRYNHHEGGATFQMLEKVRFLTGLWPTDEG